VACRADRSLNDGMISATGFHSELALMDIYNLGKVDSITDDASMLRFGFSIIGIIGRPIVTFEFEIQEEAEAAHKAMQAIVAKAKLITPYADR
jgi:hypothetical protein